MDDPIWKAATEIYQRALVADEELKRKLISRENDRWTLIEENWQQLAAAAWAGYLKEGRGALRIDLKGATNTIIHPGVNGNRFYFALDSLNALAEEPDLETQTFREQLLDRLRRYDPMREIVLLIADSDNDSLRCKLLHSDLTPPDAYRAENDVHRNNPDRS